MNKIAVCPKCGLPKEICVCVEIEKEGAEKIKIYIEKKKFHKVSTMIEGIPKVVIDDVAKKLKKTMACGGTTKEERIELQGDHRQKVKAALIKMGYGEENISVV